MIPPKPLEGKTTLIIGISISTSPTLPHALSIFHCPIHPSNFVAFNNEYKAPKELLIDARSLLYHLVQAHM
jgi:hypothetical protein